MAILIDIKNPDWLKDEVLFDDLRPHVPDIDLRLGADPGEPEDIEMLVVSGYVPGDALKYPKLKVIQKTGAGVENILRDEGLPESVQLARSNSDKCGKEMGEYALAYVLQEQRHLRIYHLQQSRQQWIAREPPHPGDSTVAVLGLGRMGYLVAQRFVTNEFSVLGWSRTEKSFPGIDCYAGADGLRQVLEKSDYVISVLPTTSDTMSMFNADLLRMFKPGSFLISIGRGDQVNEPDLINALDNNQLAGAILDVCSIEPLPANNPLWVHPKVQITPHISGWHSVVAGDIAENYRRMISGETLLNLVDRNQGY